MYKKRIELTPSAAEALETDSSCYSPSPPFQHSYFLSLVRLQPLPSLLPSAWHQSPPPPFHFPRHGASHVVLLFFSQHSSSSFFLLLWHCGLVDYLRQASCIISWHVYMSYDPKYKYATCIEAKRGSFSANCDCNLAWRHFTLPFSQTRLTLVRF